MRLKKLIEESFDVKSLERSIQNFENNVKEQNVILQNMKIQKNELIRDEAERQKRETEIANQQKSIAIQKAKQNAIANTSAKAGAGTVVTKPTGTSATV